MKKILIIEDTLEVNENICEILSLDGYHTLSATNGKDGVQLAVSELPDIIICDIMMPELNGYGVLKILSKNKLTKGIPFIFLTAKSEMKDLRKGMELGADDFIIKPFDDTELLMAIEARIKKDEERRSSTSGKDSISMIFSVEKSTEELSKLSQTTDIREYNKKEKVYSDGNRAYWLFYVIEGAVKRYCYNDYGKELITDIYTKGDFFGFNPLLEDKCYTDCTMALESSKIRLISKEEFKQLLVSNNDYAIQILKLISQKAEDRRRQLMDMAYSSVRRKVAASLLSRLGYNELSVDLSRDDLAAFAGIAKETLIRTLTQFKNEGLIAVNKNAIRLLKKDMIEAIPQG